MEEKGVTIRKTAEATKISSSTLNSWRSGSAPEDYLAVKRLADFLEVSFSFLLTGEDENRKSSELSISEVLKESDVLFDGFAKITVQRLIPRNKKEN